MANGRLTKVRLDGLDRVAEDERAAGGQRPVQLALDAQEAGQPADGPLREAGELRIAQEREQRRQVLSEP